MKAVSLLLLFFFSSLLLGTTIDDALLESIEELVAETAESKSIPGLSLSVRVGDVVTVFNYGYANLEHHIPVTKDSIFEIGSISKTITAVGILQLRERGLIDLDDTIETFFPDFPSADEITVRDLLQHSSGIRELTDIEEFKNNMRRDWSPQELIEITSEFELDFAPGTSARYSNINFILLGLIIEELSGIQYEEYIADNILAPLGMINSMLGSQKTLVYGRASGYRLSEGVLENAEFESLASPFASGAIISTTEDLVKFTRVFTPNLLLSKESIDEMLSQTVLRNGELWPSDGSMTFGLGLDMLYYFDRYVPGKTGGISGFNSYFLYLPEKDLAVAVTANLDDSLREIVLLAMEAADLLRSN